MNARWFHCLVYIILLVWTACLSSFGPCRASAASQESVASQSLASAAEKQTDLAELMYRSNALGQKSLDLRNRLARLPDLDKYAQRLKDIEDGMRNLTWRVERMQAAKRYVYDRLVDLNLALQTEKRELMDIGKPLIQAIDMLETAKREFTRDKLLWEKLNAEFSKEGRFDSVKALFSKARTEITGALTSIDQALGPIVELQSKVLDVQDRLQVLESRVESMLAEVRSEILSRSAPSMFSDKYYDAFDWDLLRRTERNLFHIELPGRRFVARWGWVLFLHVLLTVLLATLLVRNRDWFGQRRDLTYAGARPISLALLLGAAGGWPFYQSIPSTWRFFLWSVVAIAVSRLTGVRIKHLRRRLSIQIMAGLLIVEEYFRVVTLPVAIERAFVFFVALVGLGFFVKHARSWRKTEGLCLPWWVDGIGGVLCAIMLVAELGGFSNLSKHVFSSSLKTLFVVLAGMIIAESVRHCLEAALGVLASHKMGSWVEEHRPLLDRVWLLTKILVAVILLDLTLVIWKFYEGPWDALTGLVSLGIDIGGQRISLGLVLAAGIVLYGSLLLSWFMQTLLLKDVLPKRKLQRGVQLSVVRLVHYALILVGVLSALAVLGLDLKNITIIGGALGVGIGFGLQAIVNNFVSGLILLFERPIRVGDYIEINGKWAEIKYIGLRATTVQTFDRADIVVPNSELITNQVINWTRSDRLARLKIPVGVAYGSDVGRVMQILMECVSRHREILRSPQPKVYFVGLGDSSMNFEVRFYLKDIDQWYAVQSDIYKEIEKRFHEAGIEIPFPQRDVHLRDSDRKTHSPADSTAAK